MTEQECLDRMVAPGTRRPGKYREGVIQVHVTRACDKSCFGCTQGSNLAGRVEFISVEHFEQAVKSLSGYFGVVGVFGGNPAMHPRFDKLCHVLQDHVPWEQRGLWCNNPRGWGRVMAETFNPAVSNLNVHLDRAAYDEFKRDWPACNPCGLHSDSRHSPPYVAMKDVVVEEYRIWELISGCDINQHWSAMIGVFRGELRAWFCEIAGAQAMLHQDEPDYPDTGIDPNKRYCWIIEDATNPFPRVGEVSINDKVPVREGFWWQLPMHAFDFQVRKHCFDCGVPLRGHGENAMTIFPDAKEQCSKTHQAVYRPKRPGRKVGVVTELVQLGSRLDNVVRYIQNSGK